MPNNSKVAMEQNIVRLAALWLIPILLLAGLAFPASADPGPAFFKKFIVDATVHPDGLDEVVSHIEMQATNDAAAHGLAQQPIYFSESMQKVEIIEAYTLKADGRKLPVDTKAVFPQAPPGSPQIPMFNDQKLYMLVFPDVSAGDATVYTTRTTELKPYFPGNYLGHADLEKHRLQRFRGHDPRAEIIAALHGSARRVLHQEERPRRHRL
jgi:hypothetical protein